MVPTVAIAEELLRWAEQLNPGPWTAHSRAAARAARTIAAACGMDADRCYALGLLHDIGRYEGVRALHHVLAGHDLMMQKGYGKAALVCLTHSFPLKDLDYYLGANDCTEEETQRIIQLLSAAPYDDEIRLIQLCDGLSLPEGVTVMEQRLVEVAMRYGTAEGLSEKWRTFLSLKQAFERRLGHSIYALFAEEISARLGLD